MQPNLLLQQQYHIIGSNLLVYLVYLNLVFFSLILSINCSIVYVSFVSCGLCEYAPFQTHIVITAYGSHFATSPYLKTCVNTFYAFEDVLRLVKEQNEPHYIFVQKQLATGSGRGNECAFICVYCDQETDSWIQYAYLVAKHAWPTWRRMSNRITMS